MTRIQSFVSNREDYAYNLSRWTLARAAFQQIRLSRLENNSTVHYCNNDALNSQMFRLTRYRLPETISFHPN